MTRTSRSGDVSFAIVPFLLMTALAGPVLARVVKQWVDIPTSCWMVAFMLAWAAVFVWRRGIDVRGVIGERPPVAVLLRWCAVGALVSVLAIGALLLLAAAAPDGLDLERSFRFGRAADKEESGLFTALDDVAFCVLLVLETFLCQGLVLRNLLGRMGLRAAVLATALVAAVFHADPLFLMHLGFAIVLVVAGLETRSLWTVFAMQVVGVASMVGLGELVDGFVAVAPNVASRVHAAWQGGPVAATVFVLLMAWLALVAAVFLRVPAEARPQDDAPLAAA